MHFGNFFWGKVQWEKCFREKCILEKLVAPIFFVDLRVKRIKKFGILGRNFLDLKVADPPQAPKKLQDPTRVKKFQYGPSKLA